MHLFQAIIDGKKPAHEERHIHSHIVVANSLCTSSHNLQKLNYHQNIFSSSHEFTF